MELIKDQGLYVAIARDQFADHCCDSFSDLVAKIGQVDGFHDAAVLDHAIWSDRVKLPGEKYTGCKGFAAAARLHGFAVFRRGHPREFSHDDTAALVMQGW